jgi:hypothetical protein
MLYKTTTKLFRGQYQHKVVLSLAGAQWFRSGDFSTTLTKLAGTQHGIKSSDDKDYAIKLATTLNTMTDIEVRVESPWLSVYLNDTKQVDKLVKLDRARVKYVSSPLANTTLEKDTVIMPKMDFDYRITLGKTTHEHSAFIEWAEGNKNLKLTKSAKRDLAKNRTWGGTHFYISGEKNLLLTRMHLGEGIAKVERIVKS